MVKNLSNLWITAIIVIARVIFPFTFTHLVSCSFIFVSLLGFLSLYKSMFWIKLEILLLIFHFNVIPIVSESSRSILIYVPINFTISSLASAQWTDFPRFRCDHQSSAAWRSRIHKLLAQTSREGCLSQMYQKGSCRTFYCEFLYWVVAEFLFKISHTNCSGHLQFSHHQSIIDASKSLLNESSMLVAFLMLPQQFQLSHFFSTFLKEHLTGPSNVPWKWECLKFKISQFSVLCHFCRTQNFA